MNWLNDSLIEVTSLVIAERFDRKLMLPGIFRLGQAAFTPGVNVFCPEIGGAMGCHDCFL